MAKRAVEDFIEIDAKLLDTHLPDPGMLEFYNRLKNREIVWNGEIDDSTIEVGCYIAKWNAEDKDIPVEERKPIKIFINSDGGYLSTIMHVIDMITLSKTPVHTIGMGRVYSAGGLLLIAGHKRYVFENTTYLLHDGSTGTMGTVAKCLDNLEFTKRQEERIRKYVLDRTNIPESEYDANYRKDWYLFSDEMITYGVADEIVTDINVIL